MSRSIACSTGALYDGYDAIYYVHKLQPSTASHFARRLLATFPFISERHKVHRKVTRGVRSVRWRSGGNHDADLIAQLGDDSDPQFSLAQIRLMFITLSLCHTPHRTAPIFRFEPFDVLML